MRLEDEYSEEPPEVVHVEPVEDEQLAVARQVLAPGGLPEVTHVGTSTIREMENFLTADTPIADQLEEEMGMNNDGNASQTR